MHAVIKLVDGYMERKNTDFKVIYNAIEIDQFKFNQTLRQVLRKNMK